MSLQPLRSVNMCMYGLLLFVLLHNEYILQNSDLSCEIVMHKLYKQHFVEFMYS